MLADVERHFGMTHNCIDRYYIERERKGRRCKSIIEIGEVDRDCKKKMHYKRKKKSILFSQVFFSFIISFSLIII